MEKLTICYELVQRVKHKSRYNFVSFDIVDYYPPPPISEELLDKAILWTKTIVNITDEHVTIFKHARKPVLYALNKLRAKFGNNIGLYRDDGLALIEGTSLRLVDKTRKYLCTAFQKLRLKITAKVNYKIVNFLDIMLNLANKRIIQALQKTK